MIKYRLNFSLYESMGLHWSNNFSCLYLHYIIYISVMFPKMAVQLCGARKCLSLLLWQRRWSWEGCRSSRAGQKTPYRRKIYEVMVPRGPAERVWRSASSAWRDGRMWSSPAPTPTASPASSNGGNMLAPPLKNVLPAVLCTPCKRENVDLQGAFEPSYLLLKLLCLLALLTLNLSLYPVLHLVVL